MIHEPPPVAEILARLNISTARLASLLEDAGLPWLFQPAPGEWSITQIICHLRDVEVEVHQARYEQVLNQNRPFISGVSADEWAAMRSYQKQDGPAALRALLKARAATVALLDQLAPADWERTCQHAFLGITTFRELVFLALSHEETHDAQIAAVLKAADYVFPLARDDVRGGFAGD